MKVGIGADDDAAAAAAVLLDGREVGFLIEGPVYSTSSPEGDRSRTSQLARFGSHGREIWCGMAAYRRPCKRGSRCSRALVGASRGCLADARSCAMRLSRTPLVAHEERERASHSPLTEAGSHTRTRRRSNRQRQRPRQQPQQRARAGTRANGGTTRAIPISNLIACLIDRFVL